MSQPNTTLTKLCSSCGVQKPLSAFLQMNGLHGTMYGNICSSCRKSHADKFKKPLEADDGTISASGKKIDANAKIKGDLDKKELSDETEKEYYDKRDKTSSTTNRLIEKQINASDDLRKRQRLSGESASTEKKNLAQEEAVDSKAQQETKIEADFSADTRVAKQKYGAEFLKFAQLMGKSSAIGNKLKTAVDTLQQAGKKLPTNLDKKSTLDFIDNTWKPGSKKR